MVIANVFPNMTQLKQDFLGGGHMGVPIFLLTSFPCSKPQSFFKSGNHLSEQDNPAPCHKMPELISSHESSGDPNLCDGGRLHTAVNDPLL